MHLTWIRYNKKCRLLLYLGEHNHKLVGIETTNISTESADQLAKESKKINNMPLKEKISYIDDKICKIKQFIKTFDLKKTTILDSYDLPS